MADHVSKRVRSRIMAAVRSRGNATTEVAFGKLLWNARIRGYRKHWPVLGRPDFAWPGRKIAVFVDGCFWHGCRKCKYLPRTNTSFWAKKLLSNKKRDRRITAKLRREGWVVIRIRECQVRAERSIDQVRKALTAR